MSYKINKYPDKTSYIEVKSDLKTGWTTFKLNNYEDIWHLKQYVDAYVSENLLMPNILIPNLIDAQADRRFANNQSFGLKLVIQELAKMNANFKIFHPHNPEAVEIGFEVLGTKVVVEDNSKFIEQVLSKLGIILKKDEPILFSADSGGFKPLMKLCDKIGWTGETYSASKARKWTEEGSKLTQLVDKEDFQGKDILIIDDLSIGGGTFKGLSKLLKERNCGKLYLAVSHMTIQNLGEDPVTNYFDKVFTTNSKFEHYYLDVRDSPSKSFPENLEIIKLF